METGISVACEVTVGTFISEYFVRIQTVDSLLWQGIVDREMVIDIKNIPTEGEFVKGRLYAYLISFDNEKAIIELPVENSFEGRRICVLVELLRKEKIPA